MEGDFSFAGVSVSTGASTEVHLRGGRLASQPAPEANALPGRFVLSGLVDAHVHLALDLTGARAGHGHPDVVSAHERAQLDAGVLLVRDMGAPAGVRISTHEDGPVVLAAGRFLAPAGGYLPGLFEPVPPSALVATALAELAATGSGWVKLVFDFPEHFTGPQSFAEAVPNYDTEAVIALVDAVHKTGGRVAAHVSGLGDSALAVRAGVDSLEHGIDVDEADLIELSRRFLARPEPVIGEPADLVTYDDDPREDPDVLLKPAAVVRAGRRIR